MTRNILFVIKNIFKLYFLSATIFTVFRIILFGFHMDEVFSDSHTNFIQVVSSFIWGMRYDLLVSGFILIIPYTLLVFYDFNKIIFLKKISFWWIFILFGIAFMLTAGDIVYFNKFYEHITIHAMEWFDEPTIVLGMIFQEPRYWFMFLPFFVILYLFYKILKKIFENDFSIKLSKTKKIVYYLGFFILIFFSIRGKISGHPLEIEDAYVHKNAFLNQMKLNPVFVLEKSYESVLKNKSNSLELMNEQKAVKYVQKQLKISSSKYKSPLARIISYNGVARKKMSS